MLEVSRKIKTIIISLLVSLVSFFLVSSLMLLTLFFNINTQSSLIINKENNELITTNQEIKILQLTDTQFSTYGYAYDAFSCVKKVVLESNPDLIVLTGDNLTVGGRKDHVKILIKFLDSFKTPWALVYGNHDREGFISLNKQSELYENSEYGIFKKGNIKDSYGNYYYNIKRNGKIIYSLIFMDSKKKGFEKEHVEWYENTITKIKEDNNGELVNSLMFFHIPIAEVNDAYNEYLKDTSLGKGNMNEEFSIQTTNSNMFEKIVELSSTKAIIYGHDHVNTIEMKYNDVLFSYGVKTGRAAYFDGEIQGGKLYTIMHDNTLKTEYIFV